MGPPDSFYRSALMFLAYTPLESIPQAERYTLATDISLAALTGEGVFNFGEVVRVFLLGEKCSLRAKGEADGVESSGRILLRCWCWC